MTGNYTKIGEQKNVYANQIQINWKINANWTESWLNPFENGCFIYWVWFLNSRAPIYLKKYINDTLLKYTIYTQNQNMVLEKICLSVYRLYYDSFSWMDLIRLFFIQRIWYHCSKGLFEITSSIIYLCIFTYLYKIWVDNVCKWKLLLGWGLWTQKVVYI